MKFYAINNNLFDDSKYAYGEPVDLETGDYEKCSVCGSPISMRRWLPPLKAKLSRPLYGAFVFGSFTNFLASERFKTEYEASDLKGIEEFEKVDIVKVNRIKNTSSQPPNYFNVLISGSTTKVDEERSKFLREGQVNCNSCRIGGVIKSFEGIFLEEKTWDRHDIFHPIGLSGTIVVSQKFYEFVKDNKFTNISLVPAEEYIAPWVHK